MNFETIGYSSKVTLDAILYSRFNLNFYPVSKNSGNII